MYGHHFNPECFHSDNQDCENPQKHHGRRHRGFGHHRSGADEAEGCAHHHEHHHGHFDRMNCHDGSENREGGHRRMFGRGRQGGRWGRGFDHDHDGHGHRGGHRPLEQGDLRWLALDLIAAQPRHGYEIIKAIEEAVDGHYAPSPGAVYPMLTLLEETGLISAEADGAKKRFNLTEAGRAEIEANKHLIEAARGRLNILSQKAGGTFPPELQRATDNFRAALQVRLSKGELSPESLSTITAAIDRAAGEIERS